MLNQFCILFVLTSGLLYSAFALSEWHVQPVNGVPVKGGEYALSSIGAKLYLVGGRGKVPVSELDLKSKSWRQKSAPPIDLHHFQAVVLDKKIYVLGAFTGDYPNDAPVSHVYSYDVVADQWLQEFEIPSARRRGAAAAVEFDGRFYVIGGITNGHMENTVAWLDEYDPIKKQWKVLADAPHQRDHIQAAVINKKLIVVGGRQSSVATNQPYELNVTATDIYDFSKGSWSSLSSRQAHIPTPRSGFAAIAYKDYLYILGGESKLNDVADKTVHANVEVYDVKAQRWLAAESLLTPTHGFQAALIKSMLYISNGKDDRENLEAINLSNTKLKLLVTP